MGKDLTTSRIDRQNILNNELAIEEMHNSVDTKMVFWNDKYYFTKEMLASYFDVETRTIERYISAYSEELKENGYELQIDLPGVKKEDIKIEMNKNLINISVSISKSSDEENKKYLTEFV